MRFHYNKLILWMNNGNIRTLDFKPNKVNIITGGSETGKSAILAIIDYIFFAKENIKITREFINENVKWYGVNFHMNNKEYTIARGCLDGTIPSKDYYFSLNGEIPQVPKPSIGENELKRYISEEFSIGKNTIVPFGGRKIKAGSKLSLKYFMLFNSQDENTIDSSDVFFDKQTDVKYKEALERTFDLAVGISSEKNVLIKDRINALRREISKYERKQSILEKEINAFEKEKTLLVKKAKKLKVIPNEIADTDECIENITKLIEGEDIEDSYNNSILDNLLQQEKNTKREIRILKNFKHQINEYSSLKRSSLESLQPIKYLADNYGELINHPSVYNIINGLKGNYIEILDNVKKVKKSDYGIEAELNKLSKTLKNIKDDINKISNDEENVNLINKYMFLGEAKTKIELFNKDVQLEDYSKKIEGLVEQLEVLEKQYEANEDKRTAIIKLIEMSASGLMSRCKEAMETYAEYQPVLNYKEKKLELMNPKIAEISKVVGSSSNYLFLHLFFILALHEVIIAQKIKYVPSYIILDQPSRPYYDNNNEKFKDREKITIAIRLLNDYIDIINKEYNEEFQFIVFEHIPKEIWTDMDNVHLVEEFINGNKLIRKCDISV